MKEEEIILRFNRAKFNELSKTEQELIEKAKDAFSIAYAPYSGFLVGASVLLENAKIISGNNQENVAYPAGLCAERVALFYAGSKYPEVGIKTIAISAKLKTFEIKDVVSPCGSCRQVMAEYQQKQGKNIRILLHSHNDDILIAEQQLQIL